MADKFPTDEFDAAPMHGGRHRIRRTAKHRILEFLKISTFSALVALAGYAGLKGIDSLNFFRDTATLVTQPVVETAKPLVVVLDATDEPGLATKWATNLSSAGFNVAAAANFEALDGTTPANTVVYVQSVDQQATAESIAKRFKLENVKIEISQNFPDAITVVLGKDMN